MKMHHSEKLRLNFSLHQILLKTHSRNGCLLLLHEAARMPLGVCWNTNNLKLHAESLYHKGGNGEQILSSSNQ